MATVEMCSATWAAEMLVAAPVDSGRRLLQPQLTPRLQKLDPQAPTTVSWTMEISWRTIRHTVST